MHKTDVVISTGFEPVTALPFRVSLTATQPWGGASNQWTTNQFIEGIAARVLCLCFIKIKIEVTLTLATRYNIFKELVFVKKKEETRVLRHVNLLLN
jgi:hypothetical protein